MGTNKYSKNILISHDIIAEERRRLERERKRKKIKMKNEKEWIGPENLKGLKKKISQKKFE